MTASFRICSEISKLMQLRQCQESLQQDWIYCRQLTGCYLLYYMINACIAIYLPPEVDIAIMCWLHCTVKGALSRFGSPYTYWKRDN